MRSEDSAPEVTKCRRIELGAIHGHPALTHLRTRLRLVVRRWPVKAKCEVLHSNEVAVD
jgi:hypothetical protein